MATTPTIKYRLLGNSGLRVFPLCLGAMHFGENKYFKEAWGCSCPYDEAEKIFLKYLSIGGNFIDTANFYGQGSSEEVIGKILQKNNIDRDSLVIASKYSLPMAKDPNMVGNHKKNMFKAVDDSLKRLGTTYLDILYVHYWDHTCNIEDVMKWLDQLVATGKVLHVAISDSPAWIVATGMKEATTQGYEKFACYQGRYGLLDRAIEQEVVPCCRKNNMPIIPWAVLGQGKLTGKFTRESMKAEDTLRKNVVMTERDFVIQDKVIEIAKKHKVSPSALANAWMLHRKSVGSVLLGCRTLKQLEDTIKCLDVQLTKEEDAELLAVSKASVNPVFPFDIVGDNPCDCVPMYFEYSELKFDLQE